MFIILPCFFFFNDTATTEIYTLSLHDALPISNRELIERNQRAAFSFGTSFGLGPEVNDEEIVRAMLAVRANSMTYEAASPQDRKSTRLNSSHANISYAVFCLKKKKKNTRDKAI